MGFSEGPRVFGSISSASTTFTIMLPPGGSSRTSPDCFGRGTAKGTSAGREWEAEMKKASEYRQHAEECRALARSMPAGKDRDQLLEMSATWDNLATERSKLVQRHPELAIRGEHEEELQRANKV